MTEEALVALVRERPDDERAWAVLQDWLLSHDDARGRLAAAPQSQVPALLAELAPAWLGREVQVEGHVVSIASERVPRQRVQLEFARGHVRKLTVRTWRDRADDSWGQSWICPLLGRILSQPVGQLIEEMEIRANPLTFSDYAGLVESITAHGPLAVRRLYCGDDDQPSWTRVPDCTSLWAVAPWLQRVVLEGSNIELGELHHERLAHLELISGGLPAEPLEALARARLPALRHLDVWFGASEYGAECDVDDVQPLLDRELPALRHMGLRNAEFSDALVPRLLRARWLPGLESLSLADGILREAGGEALLAGASALRHLHRLDLDECYLSEALLERLGALPGLVEGDQRAPEPDDPDGYYVSMGE